MKQLALITVVMMSYLRLLSHFMNHLDQLIKSSYLVDLDAHYHGYSLENGGRVAEQIVFALLRLLFTFGD